MTDSLRRFRLAAVIREHVLTSVFECLQRRSFAKKRRFLLVPAAGRGEPDSFASVEEAVNAASKAGNVLNWHGQCKFGGKPQNKSMGDNHDC